MKQNAPTDRDIITQAIRIFELTTYAKKLSETDELSHKLAAALIYANIAEYHALRLLRQIELYINLTLPENPKFNIAYLDDNVTNIGSLLKKIKMYDFQQKDVVIRILNEIRVRRNELFHNLLVPKKKWSISKNFEILKRNTDELSNIIESIKYNKIR